MDFKLLHKAAVYGVLANLEQSAYPFMGRYGMLIHLFLAMIGTTITSYLKNQADSA
jgi:hypothetical protein